MNLTVQGSCVPEASGVCVLGLLRGFLGFVGFCSAYTRSPVFPFPECRTCPQCSLVLNVPGLNLRGRGCDIAVTGLLLPASLLVARSFLISSPALADSLSGAGARLPLIDNEQRKKPTCKTVVVTC